MAEEFHTGICGENWWNLSRNMFISGSSGSGSHADLAMNTYGSWLVPDHTARSCKDSSNLMMNNFSDNLFQDLSKQTDSNSDHSNNSVLIDNNLQMMGFGNISSSSTSPSSSSDWNCQTLLQENMNSNSNSNTKEWSSNQEFSPSFSMGLSSSSTITSYDYPSTIIQSLFESDPQPQQQQQQQISYSSASNYGNLLNELSPSWSKLSSNSLKPLSTTKQQQQLSGTGVQFSNNTPFWNASEATSLHDIRPNLLQNNNNSQFLLPSFDQKPNCLTIPSKIINEQVRDSGSVVKKGSEPVTKRPRIETPSPLPTFKVRKEKLGDRITALQQLVSPFGKTDTASVLHEAIEYIKFLHDQVSVLSTPYMKNGNGNGIQNFQAEKLKESEGVKQDLKSRGLCLVPISSTFPVANETTADFWTPTFGGTFR